jgi:hypothetical protein
MEQRLMRRLCILTGAAIVTLALLALAMLLGSASFDYRRFSQHQGRLQKVMREHPTADRLTQGFADEGTVLLAVATTPEEVEREASTRGGKKAAEIREKAARSAEMRVYQTADMLYFIYFDAAGVMRDFTCVSR